MIAANPLAAQAGLNVLKRGGSAVDAAIAVQAMLSLVEPQSSGIGGGAFMTYFDARTRKVSVYDGREVAPAQAVSTMFLDATGQPLPFNTAVVSGRATGVPGAVKMLGLAHDEHGKLPWSSLFGDAERAGRPGLHRQPAPRPDDPRRFCREPCARRDRLFLEARRQPAECRRAAGEQALCRVPSPSRGAGTGGALFGIDRGQDHRPHPRRAARRVDDHGRPRRVQADQARAGVRPVPRLSVVRAAPAVERRRPHRADDDPRQDRHRAAPAERPAGLVSCSPRRAG